MLFYNEAKILACKVIFCEAVNNAAARSAEGATPKDLRSKTFCVDQIIPQIATVDKQLLVASSVTIVQFSIHTTGDSFDRRHHTNGINLYFTRFLYSV